MVIELITMNGYGQFVWPAFFFSLASCSYLYLTTRSEFKKTEKIYSLEFEKQQIAKIEFIRKQKNIKEILSIN